MARVGSAELRSVLNRRSDTVRHRLSRSSSDHRSEGREEESSGELEGHVWRDESRCVEERSVGRGGEVRREERVADGSC